MAAATLTVAQYAPDTPCALHGQPFPWRARLCLTDQSGGIAYTSVGVPILTGAQY
jgi:hypothetical protein